jgi:hypothetical protein
MPQTRRLYPIYAGIRSVIPGKLEEYVALDRGVDRKSTYGLPKAVEWKFDTFDLQQRANNPRIYENYSQYMCVGATNSKKRFQKTMRKIFGELRGTREMKFQHGGERRYTSVRKDRRKTIIPHLQFLTYTMTRMLQKPYFFPARNLERFQAGYSYGRRRRRIAPIPPFYQGAITQARQWRGLKPHSSPSKWSRFRVGRRRELTWYSWDPRMNQVIRDDNHHHTQYGMNRSSPYDYSSSNYSRHHGKRDYNDDDTRTYSNHDSSYSSGSYNSEASDYYDGGRTGGHHRYRDRDGAYSGSRSDVSAYGGDGYSGYDMNDYGSTTSSGSSRDAGYL